MMRAFENGTGLCVSILSSEVEDTAVPKTVSPMTPMQWHGRSTCSQKTFTALPLRAKSQGAHSIARRSCKALMRIACFGPMSILARAYKTCNVLTTSKVLTRCSFVFSL